MARKTEYSWRHYLPRAKAKRGRRRLKGRSSASFITLRRPLAERPGAVADRRTPGHWEADLMLFRIYGQAILTLHERHSRLLIAARPPGKAAAPIGDPVKGRIQGFCFFLCFAKRTTLDPRVRKDDRKRKARDAVGYFHANDNERLLLNVFGPTIHITRPDGPVQIDGGLFKPLERFEVDGAIIHTVRRIEGQIRGKRDKIIDGVH